MERVFIPASDAIIFWNDIPSGSGLDDVRVVAMFDPDRDRIGERFENSNGALLSDWLVDPRANPEAVFHEFMAGEYVQSCAPEFRKEIRISWLLEFAKIKECDWAREALSALHSEPEDAINAASTQAAEGLKGFCSEVAAILEERIARLPDHLFGEFFNLVHAEWEVLGSASPSWLVLLMKATEDETERRAKWADRVQSFAARHGLTAERAEKLLMPAETARMRGLA